MRKTRSFGWYRSALAGAAVSAALLGGSAPAQLLEQPNGNPAPGTGGFAPFGEVRQAQLPGGIGQGLGQGFPGGNQLGQFPGGGPGGRQGGVFGSSGSQVLASNAEVRLAAFCTDLLSDPPDGTTRFTGGGTTLVAFADGRQMPLSEALAGNLLSLRGHDDSFDPVRRDGSLALDLFLANHSGMPVRLSFTAGTAVTPSGQSAQAFPPGSERLFALAEARRLSRSNTLQYAVWAARGSTAEEVEQANLIKLPAMEIGRVQSLLTDSGLRRDFDRNRGLYEARYEEAVEKLGSRGTPVTGSTVVPLGGRAAVEGVRTAEGKGYVTIRVLQSRARFFYAAQFSDGKNGRTRVKLLHLVTGKPVRVAGESLELRSGAEGGVQARS